MPKINFTEEHSNNIKALFLELGFSGEVLAGKFGANTYTVWELLHNTSITTLQGLNKNLKNEVKALEEQDEWSFSDYQQTKANKTRKWNEYVNLLIGYKKHKEEEADKKAKLSEAKAELKAMQEEVKTPAERIADKQKEIEELEK